MPRGPTPLAAGLSAGDRSAAADTASRDHGRVPPASTVGADPPHPVRAGARGGCSPGGAVPAPTVPARSDRTVPRRRVPVDAGLRMVHARPRAAPEAGRSIGSMRSVATSNGCSFAGRIEGSRRTRRSLRI